MVRKLSFEVDGLTCDRCLGRIMDHIRELPGVHAISLSGFNDGSARVEVDYENTLAFADVIRALIPGGFRVAGVEVGRL